MAEERVSYEYMARSHGPLAALRSALIVCFAAAVIAVIGMVRDAVIRSRPQADPSKLVVAVTLPPFADAVRNIGGDAVCIRPLYAEGADPFAQDGHVLLDRGATMQAGLLVYGGPLVEPRATALISELTGFHGTLVDASRGSTLLAPSTTSTADAAPGADPYFWLDADNAVAMADAIRDALILADPVRADAYRERAREYESSIRKADVDAADAFHVCRTRTFIEGGGLHFAYLARRYNLTYLSAHPDATENPPDLAGYAAIAREKALPVVFYDSDEDPRIASAIANLSGTSIASLCSGSTYSDKGGLSVVDLLNADVNALAIGMECIRR
jgi:zinc transport system substrate-binding protein